MSAATKGTSLAARKGTSLAAAAVNKRTSVANAAGLLCTRRRLLLRHETTTTSESSRRHKATVTSFRPDDDVDGGGGGASDGLRGVKPMSSLDGPPGWPLIGNFMTYLKKENRGKLHEVQLRQHKTYGKIFREKWGTSWQCHVSDPKLFEEVYRQEGVCPNRPSISSWILYRIVTGLPYGLSTAQGSEWNFYRTEFGKRMLCPTATKKLIGPFNAVADDLVVRLKQLRDDEGERAVVSKLPNEMYKWSLEAVGTFLCEARLGCLDSKIPPRTQEFIDATQVMMESSVFLIVGDRLHQRLNSPVWRRHKAAWDKMFSFTKKLIDEKIKALDEQTKSEADENDALYLTYLLSNKNLTMDQIYSNITELLLGGTDTTANSFCFIAYLLSKNREAQEQLRSEVLSVLEGRDAISSSDLENMKYLKGVIREGLRLYPVASMNCRILDEDVVINDYLIPKKTMFVLNHYASGVDDETFPNADKFQPERWLRGCPESGQHHAFSCLPFGFGKRSCVGQRVAKLELMVTLAKIMQHFVIEEYPGVALDPILRILLTPGDNVPIRFVDRT